MNTHNKIINWMINCIDSPLPVSCKHVLSIISGEKIECEFLYTGFSHPNSAEEIFMCISIIDSAKAYGKTNELAQLSKEWAQLVENWSELYAAYINKDIFECSVLLKKIRKSWKSENISPAIRSMPA